MCGEKMMKAGSNCAMLGSPPRMQGKGAFQILHHLFIRITPAYAGKRQLAACCGFHHGDHPRVCGEKMCCTAMACRRSGSPPRMRGKVAVGARKKSWLGITPAYAGKSGLEATISACVWDHPRVCGEKALRKTAVSVREGSPPRMRGKAFHALTDGKGRRITPAYAGKSPEPFSACILSTGSPPHVRGKDDEGRLKLRHVGITPAYAGKRHCKAAFCAWFWDHPRVCGEKYLAQQQARLVAGSPPRMRGKAQFKRYVAPVCRITPAYAGKRIWRLCTILF